MPRILSSKRKDWDFKHCDAHQPSIVAEPQHRLGAQGVSSGISLREFPKSNIEQVKEICLFYVNKCSGKYEDNQAAARYVHQMADEIIKQLSGVAAEIKFHEQLPKLYQQLLDEWEQFFPSSLGNEGSPQVIASKLSKQAKEIDTLKNQLDSLNKQYKKDVDDLVKSVDMQIHSARMAGVNERKVNQLKELETKKMFDKTMKEAMKKHQDDLQAVINQSQNDLFNLKSLYDDDMTQKNNEIDNLKSMSDASIQAIISKYENDKRISDETISRLRSDVKEKDAVIQSLNLDEYDNDDDSMMSQSDYSGADTSGTAENSKSILRRNKALKSLHHRSHVTKRGQKSDISMSEGSDTSFNSRNKSLRERVKELEKKLSDCEPILKESALRNDILNREKQNLINELKSYKELVDRLQTALASRLESKRHEKVIQESPHVMAHTPHFLDYRDSYGLRNSNPKLSAYNRSGIF